MSAIQLGEKQITLEDLESILFDKTPIVVDAALAAKVSVLLQDQ